MQGQDTVIDGPGILLSMGRYRLVVVAARDQRAGKVGDPARVLGGPLLGEIPTLPSSRPPDTSPAWSARGIRSLSIGGPTTGPPSTVAEAVAEQVGGVVVVISRGRRIAQIEGAQAPAVVHRHADDRVHLQQAHDRLRPPHRRQVRMRWPA
jgi:hypothetical protein